MVVARRQRYAKESSAGAFPARVRGGVWSVQNAFVKARKAANLSGADTKFGEVLSIRHIRHTFATRLGDRKTPVRKTFSPFLPDGVSSESMLRTTYSGRRIDEAKEALKCNAVLIDLRGGAPERATAMNLQRRRDRDLGPPTFEERRQFA